MKKKRLKKPCLHCKKGQTKKLFSVFFILASIFLMIAFIYLGFLRTRGAVSSTLSQTDWSGGPGQTNMVDATKFVSSSNLDYSTANQLKLNQTFEAWGAGGTRVTAGMPDEQKAPRSVASGTGVIATFIDIRAGGLAVSVRAQRINTDGTRDVLWPEDGVIIKTSTDISTDQVPKIVSDGTDGAIIVFEVNSALYVQKIDVDGDPQWIDGGVQISSFNCVNHDFDVVSDNAGGVDVAFNKGSGGIQGQRILSDGSLSWGSSGKEIRSPAGGSIGFVSLATDGTNGFYFGYYFNPNWKIDLIDGSGNPPGGWSTVSFSISIGSFSTPVIISDENSGVITSWEKDGDIYIQRINSSGTQLWTSGGVNITNSADTDIKPKIALLDSGSVGVAWSWKLSGGGGDDKNIYLQKINLSDGSDFSADWPAGGTALINLNGGPANPIIAQDGSGGAYVFWQVEDSGYKLMGQRIDSGNLPHNRWIAGGTNFGNLSAENGFYFINTGDSSSLFASFVNNAVYVQKIPDEPVFSSPGSLISSIFNAGGQMNWNSLDWTADIPTGSSLSFETRTSELLVVAATNFASDGTPDADSAFNGGPGFDFPAVAAVDGNTSTGWVHDFTSESLPQKWWLGFGSARDIKRIVIKELAVPGGQYAYPITYDIVTSTDGVNWGNIIATEADDIDLTNNLEIVLPSIVNTQYIGINVKSANLVNTGVPTEIAGFSEFEVYGSGSGSGSWSCEWGSCPTIIQQGSGNTPTSPVHTSYTGPINYVDGSTIINIQPAFAFNIHDLTLGDSTRYAFVLAKDNPINFSIDPTSSPDTLIVYIEDIPDYPFSGTFSVGQAPGNGGQYLIGSSGQSLEPGHSYYWGVFPSWAGHQGAYPDSLYQGWNNSDPSFILTGLTGGSGSIDLSFLPSGQYFQYKITMTSGSTPTLTGVSVSFAPITPPPPPPTYSPEPVVIPSPPTPPEETTPPEEITQPLICSNTLAEVQASPIPEFNPTWGVGYPWGGRVQWALDHRAGIYKLYLDYLGRAPCADEVNWQLQHDSDINNIRYNILISEEYMNKNK